MLNRFLNAVLLAGIASLALGVVGRADVVVIANRSAKGVRCTVAGPEGEPVTLTLEPMEIVPVRSTGSLHLEYPIGPSAKAYELQPNSAYFFAETIDQKRVELHEIGIRRPPQLAPSGTAKLPSKPVVVKVKILVDDDQPLQRELWEKDLRERVADCSKILEQHCFARLEVVAVDTWETNDAINDFDAALNEFVQKVDPAPADIAIGFTSQFQPVKGRTNLGGVRGPFSRHGLLREWRRRVAPAERLELLVHEMGHFFGAAHSPENNTVMRPLLADKQANSVKFRIGFDPLNALAMNLVTEEMGRREVHALRQLDLRTRQVLACVYTELDRALPKDDAARRMKAMLGPVGEEPQPKAPAYIAGAKRVLGAIVKYAEHNKSLPEKADNGPSRLTGDELTEAYLRVAAGAAAKVSPANSAKAFAIGTAVAFDRTNLLRGNTLVDVALGSVENEGERRQRLNVIGQPTVFGREDLLMHFCVSAALTAALNEQLAESAGVLKELRDAQDGGSGFSFADLSADLAGIELANKLQDDPTALAKLAEAFPIADYWPAIDGLPEKLTTSEFVTQFGSPSDERFQKLRAEIEDRIQNLRGFTAQGK